LKYKSFPKINSVYYLTCPMLLLTTFYGINNIFIFKMKYLLCDPYHLNYMAEVGLYEKRC